MLCAPVFFFFAWIVLVYFYTGLYTNMCCIYIYTSDSCWRSKKQLHTTPLDEVSEEALGFFVVTVWVLMPSCRTESVCNVIPKLVTTQVGHGQKRINSNLKSFQLKALVQTNDIVCTWCQNSCRSQSLRTHLCCLPPLNAIEYCQMYSLLLCCKHLEAQIYYWPPGLFPSDLKTKSPLSPQEWILGTVR